MTGFADASGYELLMGRWSSMLGREFVAFAGIADGLRVLDVGCGPGSLAEVILTASHPAEVVGVDPSPGIRGTAQGRSLE